MLEDKRTYISHCRSVILGCKATAFRENPCHRSRNEPATKHDKISSGATRPIGDKKYKTIVGKPVASSLGTYIV